MMGQGKKSAVLKGVPRGIEGILKSLTERGIRMVQDKADRFLFKWYHGPIMSYMLALTFEGLGWKTTFAESEFLKWRSIDLDVRKPHDFRPDYEAKDAESFFACEIKVGYTRKRRSPLPETDKHVAQFRREAKTTVQWAKRFKLTPVYGLVLGCDLPVKVCKELKRISKHFILVKVKPSEPGLETCYPVIEEIQGYEISDLKHQFNANSQKEWRRFADYNTSILRWLANTDYPSPISAAEGFAKKIFGKNPSDIKWQNLFSSLSVGKSLSKWS
jgi:hypothetical protein